MEGLHTFGVLNFSSYLLGTIFIVLLPGPNSLYVLAQALSQDRSRAWAAAGGIVIGDSVLMILAALGSASLMSYAPNIYAIVRWLGALYLGFVGLQLMWHAYQKLKIKTAASTPSWAATTPALRTALTLSLTNPKAIAFFISFFTQFVDPNYPTPAVSFLILGLVLQIISIAYLSCLIILGQKIARGLSQRPAIYSALLASTGLLFIAFAGHWLIQ
jgi:leucine efflux protein